MAEFQFQKQLLNINYRKDKYMFENLLCYFSFLWYINCLWDCFHLTKGPFRKYYWGWRLFDFRWQTLGTSPFPHLRWGLAGTVVLPLRIGRKCCAPSENWQKLLCSLQGLTETVVLPSKDWQKLLCSLQGLAESGHPHLHKIFYNNTSICVLWPYLG